MCRIKLPRTPFGLLAWCMSLSVLNLFIFFLCFDSDKHLKSSGVLEVVPKKSREKLIILIWTKIYLMTDESILQHIYSDKDRDPSCFSGPGVEVEVTLDRKLLAVADAVIFFAWHTNLFLKDLPPSRTMDQLWVLHLVEPPPMTLDLTPFNGKFNWTMSYRKDSEIWTHYGGYVEKEEEVIKMQGGVSLDEWVENKKKLMTVVSSHCKTHSRRETLWGVLANQSLPIDVFGKCGKDVCDKKDVSCRISFWTNLAKDYKFYFAAENALCADYVTEKLWRTLMQGMVPVVYGGANYTELAPPNSFIDVRDFSSLAQLGKYLLWLDKNPEEYKKYFEWRSKFKVVQFGSHWCDLSRRLISFKENGGSYHNPKYEGLDFWWRSACTENRPFSL